MLPATVQPPTSDRDILIQTFAGFNAGEQIFYPAGWLGWCFRHYWWLSLLLALIVGGGIIMSYMLTPTCHEIVQSTTSHLLHIGRFGILPAHCLGLWKLGLRLGDWAFFLLTFLVFIEWVLFRQLLNASAQNLLQFSRSGRLLVNQCSQWHNFAEVFHSRIRRRSYLVPTVLVFLIMAVYVILADEFAGWVGEFERLMIGLSTEDFRMILARLFFVIQEGATPVLLALPIGGAFWVMSILGVALRKLSTDFKFDTIPRHPDDSSGLRPLGDICFWLALVNLVPQIVMLGLAMHGFRIGSGGEPLVMLSVVFALIFAIVAFFSFIWPLWSIHQHMKRRKNAYKDMLAQQIIAADREIREHFSNDNISNADLEALQKKVDLLQKLRPALRDFPTWPFSRQISVVVGSQLIITAINLVIPSLPSQIVELIGTLLNIGG